MKIKAFSKEGLQAPHKDNPQERAKAEMRDSVNKHVEQLETQVQTKQVSSWQTISTRCRLLFRLCLLMNCNFLMEQAVK